MIVMHIDANSAYLSWSAVAALEAGSGIDLREIPAVVGGDQSKRHGIVLAKSIPAKKFGIKTGESLMEANKKCPNLEVVPPDFDLYMRCSNAMFSILSEYSSCIQRYSIDECFLDYTGSEKVLGDPVETAYKIKNRIRDELGFTVNIGVSVNKILAKMGSELEKPDKVHTLFPEEMAEKMWPLPIGDLFMVGRHSRDRLMAMNIRTIGDLARADKDFIRAAFKSHGETMWNYANGIDPSPVVPNDRVIQKGVGNSLTIDHDVYTKDEAFRYILSLCEKVAGRLRAMKCQASLFAVSIRTKDFTNYRHQLQTDSYTDSTVEIYRTVCDLFEQCWHGEPIRQIGVSTGNLSYSDQIQLSIFDSRDSEKQRQADRAVDEIRERFGKTAITRATFVNGPIKPIGGGVNEGNFIMMGGYGDEDSGKAD